MVKPEDEDWLEIILANMDKVRRRAWETAVRTGTALITTNEAGEVIEYRPPFKYILVPIEDDHGTTSKSPKNYD